MARKRRIFSVLALLTAVVLAPLYAEGKGKDSSLMVINRLIKVYSHNRINDTMRLAKTVLRASRHYKVDPILVLAVISEESSFRTRAVSPAGAMGLMQIMPATGRQIASQIKLKNYSKQKIFNPYTNIWMGVFYLKRLKRRFQNNRLLFLTAYNVGPTRLMRLRKKYRPLKYGYAKKVLRTYRRYQRKRYEWLSANN